ncbi:MAG: transporter [Anaerolineae bacterium]|nr:transporter [Gemmatimonadaceae bacterium]
MNFKFSRTVATATCAVLSGCIGLRPTEPGPIVTDRPDFTESTDVVPTGMLQVEGGYTYARAAGEHGHTVGEILIRVPIARRLEFRAEPGSYISASGGPSEFEDGGAGFKVALIQAAETAGGLRPAISLLAGSSTPREFGRGAYQPEAKLAIGVGLTERFAFASNLNYAYLNDTGRRFNQFSGSASLAVGLAEQIGSYLEYFIFNRESIGGSAAGYLNGGLTYQFNDDFQADVRIGAGMVGDESPGGGRYFIGLGLARRW